MKRISDIKSTNDTTINTLVEFFILSRDGFDDKNDDDEGW